MRKLILIAAGGLAREAAAVAARSTDWDLVGALDDDPALVGAQIAGAPVLGGLVEVASHPDASLVVCAGKGRSRRAIVARLGDLGVTDKRYATLIAPGVHVPTTCSVGVGSILLDGAVLTADVTVGRHVVSMPGVVMTHDNWVQDYATLCARVTLGGGVRVGEGAYLGMGALVRERVEVGPDTVLGMGAVLLRDLPAGEIWAGVPAQRLPGSTVERRRPWTR